MKKLFWISLVLLFIVSCKTGDQKLIVESFDNGNDMYVKYVSVNQGDSIVNREVFYYQDGKKRMEELTEESGTVLRTFYFPDGKKNIEGRFKGKEHIGNWTVWDNEGNEVMVGNFEVIEFKDGYPQIIRIFEMIDGEREKVYEIHFYENHSRRAEGPVKMGQKYGLWTGWFENGTKWSEAEFRYEVNHGISRVWHENGALYYEGEYFFGDRVGEWRFYRDDNTLIKEVDYGKKAVDWENKEGEEENQQEAGE